MRKIAWCLVVVSFVLPLSSAEKLEEVLTHMDAAAARFQAMTARLSYTKVTMVVNDRTTESGAIYFEREKDRKSFKVLIDFTEPEAKTVLFRDNKARFYRPKIAQIEEYDLGTNKERLEQFLLLGFGARGHDLLKSYNITLGNTPPGEEVVKLDLTPKGAMAEQLKKVELWLARDNWQPVQQKFTEPDGDNLTARYTGVKETRGWPDSHFQIKTEGPVKTVRPGAN
jgi:outer membrane lipoprotein-sorting protein